eukprot:scaffold15947_cov76-Amphora_coffeaeformis.AAC.1
MGESGKLDADKRALKNFTNSLTSRDTLKIQAFARRGTEELKGLSYATPKEKQEAIEWIDKLSVRGSGTDFFTAMGHAMIRAETAKEQNPEAVTIVMILSDGRPTWGKTSFSRIADV